MVENVSIGFKSLQSIYTRLISSIRDDAGEERTSKIVIAAILLASKRLYVKILAVRTSRRAVGDVTVKAYCFDRVINRVSFLGIMTKEEMKSN